MPPRLLPVAEAADALSVSASTLWRWLREGAPVARRGRRGRGSVTVLLDVEAIRAWRAQADGATAGNALGVLLVELPELVAAAAWETHVAATGPHKRQVAGELAAMAYRLLWAISDRLGKHGEPLSEATEPERLRLLRQISRAIGA